VNRGTSAKIARLPLTAPTEIESAMRPRLMAALAAILLLSSAAHAGVAEELTAAINTCAAISDDATRHACYDRLPAVVKSLAPVAAAGATASTQSTALPPVASQPEVPAAAPARADEDKGSFGFFDLTASEPVPADHISATIESFTYDLGAFIVILDNGQVWKQVKSATRQVRLSKDRKAQVTIWHSRLGYDALRIEGDDLTYHVRRIR
jgi:hypothetical protein